MNDDRPLGARGAHRKPLVRPIVPADAPALVALMERDGSPCYCRYWHFGGTNKEWEARVGLAPATNREELLAAVTDARDDGRGLVAMEDTLVGAPRDAGDARDGEPALLGWMKLTWRRTLPKLTARVPYRALPDDDATLSIGCFVVDPAARRAGVATALVEGALTWAPRWGARFVEAYPRVSESPLHDGEAWLGPHAIYTRLGFEILRDAPQYPVLRRAVG